MDDLKTRRLVAVNLVLVAMIGLMLCCPGCQTKMETGGPYEGKAWLYTADSALVQSKETFTQLLSWEDIHHDHVKMDWPTVTIACDGIRTNAPLWFTNAYLLRSNFLFLFSQNSPGAVLASNSYFVSVGLLKAQATTAGAFTNVIK